MTTSLTRGTTWSDARYRDSGFSPGCWSVRTDTRVVVERTPFERLEILPPTYETEPDYVWGSDYWYDPYYTTGSFPGVGLAPAYVERPVVIRRHNGR